MMKILNMILSDIGAMTVCFAGMVMIAHVDYLEAGVVSMCVGTMVTLFNLLSVEEKNNEKFKKRN